MASVAATVVASIITDDMLKDDGRAEAIKLMEGDGYKRRVKRKKSHTNMGGVVAKQVAKQAARHVAKRVTKQAVKRLAIHGAEELGQGAAVVAVGIGADAAINKMLGNGKHRRITGGGHRKLCGGRRYRKKRSI